MARKWLKSQGFSSVVPCLPGKSKVLNSIPGTKKPQKTKKVADDQTKAVDNIDDLPNALSDLSNLHAQELRVDPADFKASGSDTGSARPSMSLSNEDKACLRSVWKEIGPSWPEHCPDAIYRMFLSFPSTKTYFPNFDISPGSPQIQAHGRKVADALNKAVEHIDDMPAALSDLSDKHSQELRVDPVNFKLLKHTMLVTMAANYPEILTPEVLLSLDKLMEAVSRVLISRYR